MKLLDLFDTYDLDDSVLIGYYGGGNYGDELLMEVFCNVLKSKNCNSVSVMYQTPSTYDVYHHNFGYDIVPSASKVTLLKTIFKRKNIIIGGGGLWGLDVNTNILLLSSLLFFSKYILRKKVYLLGVGYYSSTSRMGHIAAWLAGKSATHIIARDDETLGNFSKITSHVSKDVDAAWNLPKLGFAGYQKEIATLEHKLEVRNKTVFMTLRRFRPGQQSTYASALEKFVADNQTTSIIVALMEPESVDPEGYRFAQSLGWNHPDIQIIDFSYNPIALYMWFKRHGARLAVIAPQFHTIITAYLCNIPFYPVVYDNKVSELYKQIGAKDSIQITAVTPASLTMFVKKSLNI